MKFLFFSFKGRISRMWWWIGTVLVVLINYAISIIVLWLIGGDIAYYWNDELPTKKVALADAMAFVLTLRISLAVDIKRIHDRGRTAYLLVPLYLLGLAIILSEMPGWDRLANILANAQLHGSFTVELMTIAAFILLIVVYFVWMIIELGFRKGTKGDSKYGPDTLNALTEPTDETI